jgi:ABC-type multidrug transport system permease subunit
MKLFSNKFALVVLIPLWALEIVLLGVILLFNVLFCVILMFSCFICEHIFKKKVMEFPWEKNLMEIKRGNSNV